MLEKIFPSKVIDRRIEQSGWLFKTTNYYVVLSVEGLKRKIQKRRVSMEQYYEYAIGDLCNLHLYSADGKYWYFSQEEAEYGDW